MSARPMLEPGPDHPITVTANPKRVTVSAEGRQIADTRGALTLQEASYPPVSYIPLSDVDRTQLTDSDHSTYCPYKGDASYFNLPALGEQGENAVWQYCNPRPAVAELKDLVAFYTDRVEVVERD